MCLDYNNTSCPGCYPTSFSGCYLTTCPRCYLTSCQECYPASCLGCNPTFCPQCYPTFCLGWNLTSCSGCYPTSCLGWNPTSCPWCYPTSCLGCNPSFWLGYYQRFLILPCPQAKISSSLGSYPVQPWLLSHRMPGLQSLAPTRISVKCYTLSLVMLLTISAVLQCITNNCKQLFLVYILWKKTRNIVVIIFNF